MSSENLSKKEPTGTLQSQLRFRLLWLKSYLLIKIIVKKIGFFSLVIEIIMVQRKVEAACSGALATKVARKDHSFCTASKAITFVFTAAVNQFHKAFRCRGVFSIIMGI